ncbi:hypothetical protein [Aeromonas sp.]|uniref:hypothetical protein n=1 Tax=Aeromonas sp. TaxID=647 RepID=UPI00258F14FB|nr:hypothetical protein [Aeromonas sp.]MCX7127808.1 hypothetical protein [Aeromonas sp.]
MNKYFPRKVMSLVFIFFFSVKASSSVLNTKLTLNQKQETLIDGAAASQTYIFNIDGSKAFLKIKSWHSMYSCDGNYIVTNKGGIISLSWNKSANGKDYFCEYPSPQFKIKMKNNKFHLNSQLLNGKNEWHLMTEK